VFRGSSFRGIAMPRKIPNVELAFLENGGVSFVSTHQLFSKAKSIVIGVPGAFTPVCSRQHVPDFVKNADKLKMSGYEQLICVTANDPFVTAAWSLQLDPGEKLRFLSDGNLRLAKALGICSDQAQLGLGERSQRYLMIVEHGKITHFRVEQSIFDVCVTGTQSLFEF
jgi:peroxiredoxin